jgi:hypothetical protein
LKVSFYCFARNYLISGLYYNFCPVSLTFCHLLALFESTWVATCVRQIFFFSFSKNQNNFLDILTKFLISLFRLESFNDRHQRECWFIAKLIFVEKNVKAVRSWRTSMRCIHELLFCSFEKANNSLNLGNSNWPIKSRTRRTRR